MAKTATAERRASRPALWLALLREQVTSLLRCQLCWRVTVFVFLSILAIEAAILVPSYAKRQEELLTALEGQGLAVLRSSIHWQSRAGQRIPRFDEGELQMLPPITGLTLRSASGAVIASYGDAGTPAIGRHQVTWGPDVVGAPVTVVAKLDSSGVALELARFVWRIAGLTLIISLFVCGATMAVLIVTVLKPVLALRERMVAAQRDPKHADRYASTQQIGYEFGEMAEAFNALVRNLASQYRIDLHEREQRFQDFARSASDWYWEMDENLRFSYFSSRYTDVTGVPNEMLLGKTREETGIPGVDPEAWRTHLADLAAHRPFRGFVHPRTKPSGQVVWLSINGQPHFDSEGNFKGYRGTGSDITRLKQVEADLRISRDKAEVANKAKSDFLANMSHEIRTPMTAVIGMAELLHSSPLNEDQRDKVETIIASGEALLGIINGVLDLSRLEAGKLEIEPRPLDLRGLMHGIESLFAERARSKGLSLHMDLMSDLPAIVLADGGRIRQILLNLIENALKFTERGEVRVRLDQRRLNGAGIELRFEVEDSGIGIPASQLERLFEKFEQQDSSTSRLYGGSGLGLAISKQLVELMDGTIGTQSQSGRGSRFWFTLPVRELGCAAASGEALAWPDDGAFVVAERTLGILLAEDNQVNQKLITTTLERLGHEVTLAGNGREAIEAARTEPYDLILMDIRMPVVDGLDATRGIRNAPGPNRETPIVAITADAMTENEAQYRAAGMNGMATKPIRLRQLVAAIDGALPEPAHALRRPDDDAAEAAPGALPAPAGHGDVACDIPAAEESDVETALGGIMAQLDELKVGRG
ncbi:MAG: ATP-binding protein [Kiloniellales bacterium]